MRRGYHLLNLLRGLGECRKLPSQARGAETVGQENDGQRNFRGWKMQDWKLTDKSAAGKICGTGSVNV